MKYGMLLTSTTLAIVLAGCDVNSLSSAPDASSGADARTSAAQSSETQTDRAAEPSKRAWVNDVFRVGDSVYVRSLAVDTHRNALWVGTSLGAHEIGLDDYAPRHTFTRKDGLANEYIFALNVDPKGNVWFGTNAGGMSRYSSDNQWKTWLPLNGLADYWIYAFANDARGGMWIGTWAGANYLDPETGELETYVKELINEWVYGLGIDKTGRVWFGTEGGVSMYDGSTWTHWTHKDGLGAENKDALPFSTNTGLGTRSRHDLGVMSSGRPTYNPNYVFSILIDNQDDSVWATTWGGGVSHFKDGKWTNLTTEDGLAGNIVYSSAQEPDGTYWFGTNRGISRYDGKTWQNFSMHQGMPGNDVYAIAIDPKGNIWAGTRGGVSRLSYTPPRENAAETGSKGE